MWCWIIIGDARKDSWIPKYIKIKQMCLHMCVCTYIYNDRQMDSLHFTALRGTESSDTPIAMNRPGTEILVPKY